MQVAQNTDSYNWWPYQQCFTGINCKYILGEKITIPAIHMKHTTLWSILFLNVGEGGGGGTKEIYTVKSPSSPRVKLISINFNHILFANKTIVLLYISWILNLKWCLPLFLETCQCHSVSKLPTALIGAYMWRWWRGDLEWEKSHHIDFVALYIPLIWQLYLSERNATLNFWECN